MYNFELNKFSTTIRFGAVLKKDEGKVTSKRLFRVRTILQTDNVSNN